MIDLTNAIKTGCMCGVVCLAALEVFAKGGSDVSTVSIDTMETYRLTITRRILNYMYYGWEDGIASERRAPDSSSASAKRKSTATDGSTGNGTRRKKSRKSSQREAEEEHVVDNVLGCAYDEAAQDVLYYVHWKGHGKSERTWEPLENFSRKEEPLRHYQQECRKGSIPTNVQANYRAKHGLQHIHMVVDEDDEGDEGKEDEECGEEAENKGDTEPREENGMPVIWSSFPEDDMVATVAAPTQDIDQVSIVVQLKYAEQAVQCFPPDARASFNNLQRRTSTPKSDRLVVGLSEDDESVPVWLNGNCARIRRSVHLSRFPSVNIGKLISGNFDYTISITNLNPELVGQTNMFRGLEHVVIVIALQRAMRLLPEECRAEGVADIDRVRSASKAYRFQQKSEALAKNVGGAKKTQEYISNRLYGKEAGLFLRCFGKALKEMTSPDFTCEHDGEQWKPSQREFAKKLLHSAVIVISGSGWKYTFSRITLQDVNREREEAVAKWASGDNSPLDVDIRGYSNDRLLRRMIQHAINCKGPAVLRKLLPGLADPANDLSQVVVYSDLANEFHPLDEDHTLLLDVEQAKENAQRFMWDVADVAAKRSTITSTLDYPTPEDAFAQQEEEQTADDEFTFGTETIVSTAQTLLTFAQGKQEVFSEIKSHIDTHMGILAEVQNVGLPLVVASTVKQAIESLLGRYGSMLDEVADRMQEFATQSTALRNAGAEGEIADEDWQHCLDEADNIYGVVLRLQQNSHACLLQAIARFQQSLAEESGNSEEAVENEHENAFISPLRSRERVTEQMSETDAGRVQSGVVTPCRCPHDEQDEHATHDAAIDAVNAIEVDPLSDLANGPYIVDEEEAKALNDAGPGGEPCVVDRIAEIEMDIQLRSYTEASPGDEGGLRSFLTRPFSSYNASFINGAGNVHDGSPCARRVEVMEEERITGSLGETIVSNTTIGHNLHHPPSDFPLGKQEYMGGYSATTMRQDNSIWKRVIQLPTLVAERLRCNEVPERSRKELASLMKTLSNLLPKISEDFYENPGCSIRTEFFFRVDGAIRTGGELLCPPMRLPSFMIVRRRDFAYIHETLQRRFWIPLEKFLLSEAAYNLRGHGVDHRQFSAEAKTALLVCAEMITMQYAKFNGSYSGIITKTMSPFLGFYRTVPEGFTAPITDEEKDILGLEHGVKPAAMVLPALKDILADQSWLLSTPRRAPCTGMSATIALVRQQISGGASSSKSLPITLENSVVSVRVLMHAYSKVGKWISEGLCDEEIDAVTARELFLSSQEQLFTSMNEGMDEEGHEETGGDSGDGESSTAVPAMVSTDENNGMDVEGVPDAEESVALEESDVPQPPAKDIPPTTFKQDTSSKSMLPIFLTSTSHALMT